MDEKRFANYGMKMNYTRALHLSFVYTVCAIRKDSWSM